jgi:predicted MFS family arabinose efflux permease
VAAAALISHYGWRSIFLGELTVGIAAIVLGLKFIPADDMSVAPKSRFPALSGFLWVSCLILILTVLKQVPHWGWTSLRFISFLVLCAIAIVSFGLYERRTKVPLVNFKLLSYSAIPLSLACELLLYFCIYMVGFFIPLLFFSGNASKATAAGLILTIEGAARLLGAAAAGGVIDRYGALPVAVAGSSLVLAGSLLFCFAAGNAQILTFGAGGFLVGLGAGVFVPANSLRLFANVPLDRHGVAAGVFATVRNLGMMTGMACAAGLGIVFSNPHVGGIRIGFSIVSLIAVSIGIAHLIVGLRASRRLRDQIPLALTLSKTASTG